VVLRSRSATAEVLRAAVEDLPSSQPSRVMADVASATPPSASLIALPHA
jgi:hypothetical protein